MYSHFAFVHSFSGDRRSFRSDQSTARHRRRKRHQGLRLGRPNQHEQRLLEATHGRRTHPQRQVRHRQRSPLCRNYKWKDFDLV